jgi:ATP-dependent DNA ligase
MRAMPLIRRAGPPPKPPANSDDWRPQGFGRGGPIRESIIEPSWDGVRVLARIGRGTILLTDEEGVDCTAEFGKVADAISAAATATELIVDGFLTVQPTQIVVGIVPPEVEVQTAGRMMAQMIAGDRVVRPTPPSRRLDPDRPIAFVAVDLLLIDGTPLLDIPLLERKRLLDGSLQQAELVRVTPFVRPPGASFITTWRDFGFSELAYKGANGRYMPGGRGNDWSLVRMPQR